MKFRVVKPWISLSAVLLIASCGGAGPASTGPTTTGTPGQTGGVPTATAAVTSPPGATPTTAATPTTGPTAAASPSQPLVTQLDWRHSTGEATFANGGVLQVRAGNDAALPFIAVGWIAGADPSLDQGMIWRSADGDAWAAAQVESNIEGSLINDVTIFGNQLIAVGGQLHGTPGSRSIDGSVWASSDQGATYQLLASGVGDEQFTKVGAGGPGLVASMRKNEDVNGSFYNSFTMWSSSDGITWTEATTDVAIDDLFEPSAVAVASDGGLVAVANSVAGAGETWGKPAFLVSADGLSWHVNEPDASGSIGGVTWTGSQFIATGSEPCSDVADDACGVIWQSIDGQTWQKTGAAEVDMLRGNTFGPSTLLPPLILSGNKVGMPAVWFLNGTAPISIVANDDPDLAVDGRPRSVATANGIVVMVGYKPSAQAPVFYVWTTAP